MPQAPRETGAVQARAPESPLDASGSPQAPDPYPELLRLSGPLAVGSVLVIVGVVVLVVERCGAYAEHWLRRAPARTADQEAGPSTRDARPSRAMLRRSGPPAGLIVGHTGRQTCTMDTGSEAGPG
jgi:hypothetical protein